MPWFIPEKNGEIIHGADTSKTYVQEFPQMSVPMRNISLLSAQEIL